MDSVRISLHLVCAVVQFINMNDFFYKKPNIYFEVLILFQNPRVSSRREININNGNFALHPGVLCHYQVSWFLVTVSAENKVPR
jgi:hypothetical protein